MNMPLSMIGLRCKARVMALTGSDTVKKHLGALGFVPGAVVTVVQISGGNMIIGIHDSRIAVNGDVTRHVMVEPLP